MAALLQSDSNNKRDDAMYDTWPLSNVYIRKRLRHVLLLSAEVTVSGDKLTVLNP